MSGVTGQTNPQRGASLQRLQETYHRRLDETVRQLIDTYGNILQAAKINDKVQNSRENFQLDVHAANLVFSAETLLKMITELKHSVMVNDFETMNENLENQTQAYKLQTELAVPAIQKLSNELGQALYELESEYYSSKYKEKSKKEEPL